MGRGLQVGVGGRAGTCWQASARAPVAQKAPEDVGIRAQQREPLSGSRGERRGAAHLTVVPSDAELLARNRSPRFEAVRSPPPGFEPGTLPARLAGGPPVVEARPCDEERILVRSQRCGNAENHPTSLARGTRALHGHLLPSIPPQSARSRYQWAHSSWQAACSAEAVACHKVGHRGPKWGVG